MKFLAVNSKPATTRKTLEGPPPLASLPACPPFLLPPLSRISPAGASLLASPGPTKKHLLFFAVIVVTIISSALLPAALTPPQHAGRGAISSIAARLAALLLLLLLLVLAPVAVISSWTQVRAWLGAALFVLPFVHAALIGCGGLLTSKYRVFTHLAGPVGSADLPRLHLWLADGGKSRKGPLRLRRRGLPGCCPRGSATAWSRASWRRRRHSPYRGGCWVALPARKLRRLRWPSSPTSGGLNEARLFPPSRYHTVPFWSVSGLFSVPNEFARRMPHGLHLLFRSTHNVRLSPCRHQPAASGEPGSSPVVQHPCHPLPWPLLRHFGTVLVAGSHAVAAHWLAWQSDASGAGLLAVARQCGALANRGIATAVHETPRLPLPTLAPGAYAAEGDDLVTDLVTNGAAGGGGAGSLKGPGRFSGGSPSFGGGGGGGRACILAAAVLLKSRACSRAGGNATQRRPRPSSTARRGGGRGASGPSARRRGRVLALAGLVFAASSGVSGALAEPPLRLGAAAAGGGAEDDGAGGDWVGGAAGDGESLSLGGFSNSSAAFAGTSRGGGGGRALSQYGVSTCYATSTCNGACTAGQTCGRDAWNNVGCGDSVTILYACLYPSGVCVTAANYANVLPCSNEGMFVVDTTVWCTSTSVTCRVTLSAYSATNTASATTAAAVRAKVMLCPRWQGFFSTCPGTSSGNTFLALYDAADTTRLAWNDDAIAGSGGCASTSCTAPPTSACGLYTLRQGCSGATSCSGSTWTFYSGFLPDLTPAITTAGFAQPLVNLRAGATADAISSSGSQAVTAVLYGGLGGVPGNGMIIANEVIAFAVDVAASHKRLYVHVRSPSFPTNALSVCAWVYVSWTQFYAAIFSFGVSTSATPGTPDLDDHFAMQLNGNTQQLLVQSRLAGVWNINVQTSTSTTFWELGRWMHVGITFSATRQLTVYKDGVVTAGAWGTTAYSLPPAGTVYYSTFLGRCVHATQRIGKADVRTIDTASRSRSEKPRPPSGVSRNVIMTCRPLDIPVRVSIRSSQNMGPGADDSFHGFMASFQTYGVQLPAGDFLFMKNGQCAQALSRAGRWGDASCAARGAQRRQEMGDQRRTAEMRVEGVVARWRCMCTPEPSLTPAIQICELLHLSALPRARVSFIT